jgi:hypothetical protein
LKVWMDAWETEVGTSQSHLAWCKNRLFFVRRIELFPSGLGMI